MTSPFLWYLNRGTGIVTLVLLTLSCAFGVFATGRRFTTLWPRFLTQGLHRAFGAVAAALLLVHAVVAVVDEFVDIRWWQAFVPWGSAYEPFALGLGTLASDLMALVIATSVIRLRLPERIWRGIHLTTYAAWVLGIAHGFLIGSDSDLAWARLTTIACAALFGVAVAIRLAGIALGSAGEVEP